MDGHKFRSGLTEVTGDGTYKCITMSKIGLKPLTSVRPSRAAPSQLKKGQVRSEEIRTAKWTSKVERQQVGIGGTSGSTSGSLKKF